MKRKRNHFQKILSKKIMPVILCGSVISFTACTTAMMTVSATTNGTFTFANGKVTSTVSDGYSVSGSVLTITKAGTYTIKGSGTGNVVVSADNVSLSLEGLNLSSSRTNA